MLITGNILCYFVMAAVDVMVEKNPGGALVFTVIGITRALQGVFAGLFFAIVQVSYIIYILRFTSYAPKL